MPTSYRLYERWKDAKGITSDSEAARVLGLKRQTPSGWRTLGKTANPAVIVRMCEDLGLEPTGYVLQAEAEKKHTDTADGKALHKLAKKYGAFVAILLIGASVAKWQTLPEIYNAAHPKTDHGIYKGVLF